MNTFTSLKIGAKSDKGLVRAGNEDAFTVTPDIASGKWILPESNDTLSTSGKGALLVIADGMGGTKGGEIAARLTTETVQNYFNSIPGIEIKVDFFKKHLETAISNANQKIIDYIRSDASLKDMGTTICLAWVFQNYLFVSWVGDSRVYLFRQNNRLIQITKDHSYVQELIDAGRITEDEAFSHPDKNIITQSLGDASRPPAPGFSLMQLEQSDRILLCTDGLNTMVRDYEIETILSRNDPAVYTVSDLIELANRNGGADNTTVIIGDIMALPLPADQVQLKVSTMPVSEEQIAKTSKPEIAGNGRQKTWIRMLAGFAVLVVGIVITLQLWPKSHTPDPAAPVANDAKSTTTEDQEAQPKENGFTDTHSYATTSQNEHIEGADLPEETVRSNARPKTNSGAGQAAANKDTARGQSVSGNQGADKPAEVQTQRSDIQQITVTPGKYYLILNSYGSQASCLEGIRKLKIQHKIPIIMGVCPGGSNFYALASNKSYDNHIESPKKGIIDVYRVCNTRK